MRAMIGLALWAVGANASWAQTPLAEPAAGAAPAEGAVSYEPVFFAGFKPQSALDMVQKVPGFSIDEGADRRGFGGAGGNVLIDGARPSAKSQDLSDVLAQIPAKQVVRIELIRASTRSEAAGQAVVVNVVRAPGAFGGVWDINLENSVDSGRVTPRGSASVNGRRGQTNFRLGVERWLEQRPLAGSRTFTDGAGALTAFRIDNSPRTWRQAKINGGLETPLWGGVARANFDVRRWQFDMGIDSFGFAAANVATGSFDFDTFERQRRREIGADYERDLGPLTVKLIGLDTRRWYANDEKVRSFAVSGARTSQTLQGRRNLTEERIFRATATWPLNAKNRIEFGGESAFNALTTQLTLAEDVGGVLRPVDLPSANVRVEEERREGFISYVLTPTPKWTLEAGVTVENSTIGQSGDSRAETELTYWKPNAQVSRKFGARDQGRVRLFRDVSQLNFGDFASSAAILDNRVAAGNPDLRPQAKWRLEAAYDHRFGKKGAASVLVAREWIDDVVDVVPVGAFDAVGNLGEGANIGVEAKATLPLDRWLTGAQVELSGVASRSEVTDPYTQRTRKISAENTYETRAKFRHDIAGGKYAWGVNYFKADENVFYRRSETDSNFEGPWVEAFVRTTAVPGVTVEVFAWNLADQEFRRERAFYQPDRNSPLSFTETRYRQFGRFVQLKVSGSF
jgi:hypothetical protein